MSEARKIQAYQLVVKRLGAPMFDNECRNIVNKLAMKYPEIFLEVAGIQFNPVLAEKTGQTLSALDEIVQYASAAERVEAIKALRTYSGFCLKRAKDVIDSLMNELVDRRELDIVARRVELRHQFDSEQRDIFEQLVKLLAERDDRFQA